MFSSLTFTGTQVLTGFGLIVLALLGLIALGRYRLRRYAEEDLKTKHANDSVQQKAHSLRKYAEVDVLHDTSVFWKVGLVTVLATVVLAFSWTTFDDKVEIPEGAMDLNFDLVEEAPQRTAEPPPPPPPPPPVVEEVPDDVIIEEEQATFTDMSADLDVAYTAPVAANNGPEAPPPPPPPPPPPAMKVKEIFKVVEEMPRFPGCEGEADIDAKKACAQQKLLEFIYANIKYPGVARENNVSGTVVVRFVVTGDGEVEDAEILRDVGAGCGDEALRVVHLMNDLPERWTPGRQRGRPVHVYFNLPVKFVLATDP